MWIFTYLVCWAIVAYYYISNRFEHGPTLQDYILCMLMWPILLIIILYKWK